MLWFFCLTVCYCFAVRILFSFLLLLCNWFIVSSFFFSWVSGSRSFHFYFAFFGIGSNRAVVLHLLTKPQLLKIGQRYIDPPTDISCGPGFKIPWKSLMSLEMRLFLLLSPNSKKADITANASEICRKVDSWGWGLIYI